jgi:hypothetical protein
LFRWFYGSFGFIDKFISLQKLNIRLFWVDLVYQQKMIAFILIITLSVNLKEKEVRKNLVAENKIDVIAKKQVKTFATGDPVDSADCYAAYLVVYNGLATTKRIKGQPNLGSNNLRITAVTQAQIASFKEECAATAVAGSDCEGVVDGLDLSNIGATDQASFKAKCEVENPNPDDGTGDAGDITFGLSNLLLLLSMVLAYFYF